MKLIKTILPNIWCTRNEYPFGGTTVKTRAFLIERTGNGNNSNNNVWIYGSSYTKDYVDHITELGGVKLQLLNHRDEASTFCNVLLDNMNAPIFCHSKEYDVIKSKGVNMKHAITYDGSSQNINDDDDDDENSTDDTLLIAYHTPGHTQGVTSYYYKPNKKDKDFSVLFTGDSLYCSKNNDTSDVRKQLNIGPMTFHAYDGNIQDMINTLTFIKDELKPTYIVSGLIEGNGNETDDEDVDMNCFIMKFQPQHIQYHIDQLQTKLKR